MSETNKPKIECVSTIEEVYENGVKIEEIVLSSKTYLYEGENKREITNAELTEMIRQFS